jgi:hypothetical protein
MLVWSGLEGLALGALVGEVESITNAVPARVARVIPAEFVGGASLGAPGASEVWVTAAEDLASVATSDGIASRLTLIDENGALIPGVQIG